MTSPAMRLIAAIATAAGFIAAGFDAHLAPTATGWWHGVTGGPTPMMVALAIAAGGFVFWLGGRVDTRPFALMLTGLLPFVPAIFGVGAGLLVFTAETLTLLFTTLTAVASHDLAPRLTVTPARAFSISLAFFLLVGRFLPGPAGPQGDEPHYLLIAESLIEDRDVDLANQYGDRAFSKFTSGDLEPHTAPRTPRDTAHSIHTAGLAALIAPGYLAGGYAGARAVVSLILALSVALMTGALATLLGAEAAAFVFVLATFATPLPVYANAVFPDSVAVLPVAFTLAFLASPRLGLLVGAAISIATLPWLHPRFVPLGFILGLAIALRDGINLKRGAAVLLPLAGSLAGLLLHFHAIFGTASLSAAYGPGFSSDVSLARIPFGVWALGFDRQFGLLLFAPVLLLGLSGFRALYRDHPGIALVIVSVLVAVVGVGGSFSMWWGGASAPARFVVGATPALLLLCGASWTRRENRTVLSGTLGFGAGLVALASLAPRALHNRDGGESGLLRLLSPDLDLDRCFPSLTVASGSDLALACAWTLVVLVLAFRPRVGPWLALVPLGFGMFNPVTPILDPFSASLRTLESWNDRRRAFSQTDRESDFELSIPLGSPAWDVAAGATLYSPRFSLPAGQWDLRVESNADAETGVLNVARISLVGGDESRGALATGLIETGERVTTIPVNLMEGERRVHVKVEGVQSRVRIRTVRLTPRSLEK